MISKIVFFLEEPSAKALLEGLKPRLVSDSAGIEWKYAVFRGKSDLEKRLKEKLQGWREPNVSFIVLRDQDAGECDKIKELLLEKCNKAGRPNTIVRIACRELESWYLGDLQAVEKGLSLTGIANNQKKRKFRDPDHLHSPSRELEELTGGKYQKVSGSRAIAPHLDITNPGSNSFRVFIEAIQKFLAANEPP